MKNRVYIYDSTLRDGAQTRGVDFSVADKQAIARELDAFGIDYIEGGWPGANPTDDDFFAHKPKLKKARLAAFGMTRRQGRSAENDPSLRALVESGVSSVCLVGKASIFQVEKALGIEPAENLKMISDSISFMAKKKIEPVFDAEHFFDGYKLNPKYSLSCLKAAFDAGARWVVLCDTNGGSLPHEIEEMAAAVVKMIPGENLGIHCHDDTENAVANSLAAVRAGVRQVQGTLNGVGERCGNANLVSIIPSLMLKMGFETGVSRENLKKITHISRFLDERLNRQPDIQAAYVGAAAFSHKGGLHVSAVSRDETSYEHVNPELVGNSRKILVSDQAGKSNFMARLKEFGINAKADDERVEKLIREVKERENQGYAYDSADASFEIMARRAFGKVPEFYDLKSFRVISERRYNARGVLVNLSEATVKVRVGKRIVLTVAEGNGPVNALDNALRKALARIYKQLKDIKLVDYKVRIINPGDGADFMGTNAVTRVLIESADSEGNRWSTIGVSENVIDASYNALADSITYKLLMT